MTTSSHVQDSADTEPDSTAEVFDLYGEVPGAPPVTYDPRGDAMTGMVREMGRNLAALVGFFAVAVTAFVVCVTLFSLAAGLLVIVVGFFVLVACLVVAGWAANMNRALLGYVGLTFPAPYYPRSAPGFRGKLRRLVDPQSWRDLLHVLVSFILSTATFSIAMSWVWGALGGLTYWFWSRYLPENNQGLPELLGFPGRFADVVFNSVLGAILLVSAPVVVHGLVRVHGAVARALLVDEKAALRQRVDDLTYSRAAAGDAEAQTLRRLERDLHDGPQQRLVRLGMDISAAQRRLESDPEQAKALLDEAYQQSQDALADIRTLSRGIAPPILSEQGLRGAVTALAARSSAVVTVDVGELTLSDAAQNAAYFTVSEALANMEKHAQASKASVEIHQVGAVAIIAVTDNGVGGASLARGHGLAGLADRLAGVDGTLSVISPVGGPTQLTATLPVLAR